MTFIERTRKLEYLRWLLQTKQPGCSKLLASRLEVSSRTVKRMINQLRNLGFDIDYCARSGTYVMKSTEE